MRFILSYLKKYTGMIIWVLCIKTFGTFMELLLPYILEFLIDEVVPQREIFKVVAWGIAMIVIAILGRQFNVMANRRAIKVASSSIYEIRRDLFKKTLDLSGNQMDEFGLPDFPNDIGLL